MADGEAPRDELKRKPKPEPRTPESVLVSGFGFSFHPSPFTLPSPPLAVSRRPSPARVCRRRLWAGRWRFPARSRRPCRLQTPVAPLCRCPRPKLTEKSTMLHHEHCHHPPSPPLSPHLPL